MISLPRCPTWVLAALIVAMLPVIAQANGRVEGRLTRPDATGLAGVVVTIEGTSTSTLTDSDGRFALDNVTTGNVAVTFALGSNTLTVRDVRIEDDTVTLDRVLDWTLGFAETITVYAASLRNQRMADAPYPVSVVDEAAIAREAANAQLPSVLASTPGVELAQSGIFDFNVNIRGLNAALTRRVLTLIDGRDPSSVLIGAQEWAAFGLPIDEVSRIEIVRGAGSALYGANAFNGVIDITSKQPRYAQGSNVELSAGEIGTVRLSARNAGALTDRSFYRVHGAYGRTDDFYVSRVAASEYSGLPREIIAPPRDRTDFLNTGVRLDHYMEAGPTITVEGGWAHTEGSMFLTGAGRTQNLGAHRPWARSMAQNSRWRLSGYYDGRYGRMASLPAGHTIVDHSMKASAQIQRLFDYGSGRGAAVVGGAYSFLRADTRDDTGASTILRGVQGAHEEALFGQLEHALRDQVKLVVGARFDASTLHDAEVSPKAGLVYSLTPLHSFRFTYSHAFETGSFIHYFTRTSAAPPIPLGALETALRPLLGGVALHLDSVPVLALGNERLRVERVDSVEGGYSGTFARKVLVGANYYFNRIADLITPLLPQVGTELGRINPAFGPYAAPSSLNTAQQALVIATLRSVLPASLFATMSNDIDGSPIFAVVSYTNLARVNLQGVELNARYFATRRLMVDASYSGLKFTPKERLSDQLVSANAPTHRVTAGIAYDDGRVTTTLRSRWANAFAWNGGVFRGQVPSATVVDLTAGFRVNRRTMVQANVANLLDNRHYEIFGGDILRRRALVSVIQSW